MWAYFVLLVCSAHQIGAQQLAPPPAMGQVGQQAAVPVATSVCNFEATWDCEYLCGTNPSQCVQGSAINPFTACRCGWLNYGSGYQYCVTSYSSRYCQQFCDFYEVGHVCIGPYTQEPVCGCLYGFKNEELQIPAPGIESPLSSEMAGNPFAPGIGSVGNPSGVGAAGNPSGQGIGAPGTAQGMYPSGIGAAGYPLGQGVGAPGTAQGMYPSGAIPAKSPAPTSTSGQAAAPEKAKATKA